MDLNPEIPVVDFGQFVSDSDSSRRDVAAEVDKALSSSGLMYLHNHGINQRKIDECFDWSKRIFNLPEAEKVKLRPNSGKQHYRGFFGIASEKVRDRPCIKETFDLGNEDEPGQFNVWPREDLLPGFRAFIEDFNKECTTLIHRLLVSLSLAINLDPANALEADHSHSFFNLSLIRYPAASRSSLQDGSIVRIPAHSDFGSLTLLFQDGVGGLEVAKWGTNTATKTPSVAFERQGDFVPVTPRHGAVVVNAGYLLMRWSNGRWKNAVHRVVGPPEVENNDGNDLAPERHSVAFFASPDPETEIEALPGCWGEDIPKKWKPINAGEYLQKKRKIAYA